MNTRLNLLCALAIIMTLAAGRVGAETKFSYDGQIRLRSELTLKIFDEKRHGQNFHDLRTRVGFKFEPTDQAFVYVQLQDSRRLGVPSSGETTTTENVDLHQAFFELQNAFFKDFCIRAGRFELNYGNQRVFGSVGWNNIGRSWEGGLFSYRPEQFRADLFILKKKELNSENYNRDFDIVGLYGTINKFSLDLFAFLELDADSGSGSIKYAQDKLKRLNLGGYFYREVDQFDFLAQGNYQLGQTAIDSVTVLDIAAFMVDAEAGYTFDGTMTPRVAVGIDYASGDDGSDSTKHKAYTDAYYTGHMFRGYMDYFVDSPKHGLLDALLRGSLNPASQWTIKGDAHYFQAAEKYTSKSDTLVTTTNIGYEFDLTIVNKSIKGADIAAGASLFIPDQHFAEAGAKRQNGYWFYLMTTVNF